MRDVICLTLFALMSCGAPMPGDPESGQAGQPGASGERGPAGPAGRDAVTAGSRLRPLWLVGADGSRYHPDGWFLDSARGERCMVQMLPGATPESMERLCAPLNFDPAQAGRYVRFSAE